MDEEKVLYKQDIQEMEEGARNKLVEIKSSKEKERHLKRQNCDTERQIRDLKCHTKELENELQSAQKQIDAAQDNMQVTVGMVQAFWVLAKNALKTILACGKAPYGNMQKKYAKARVEMHLYSISMFKQGSYESFCSIIDSHKDVGKDGYDDSSEFTFI
jgi:chromosome segregation ATPase